MSSAGRPTFNPAMGGEPRSQGGNKIFVPTQQISSRDLKGHTKLKLRQEGQGTKKVCKSFLLFLMIIK
jgi:protein CWC15